MEKNRISVKINGRPYVISGYKSEEHLYKVSMLVDRKVAELAEAYPTMSTTDIGILVALNFADELTSLKEERSELDAHISRIINSENVDAKEAMLPRLPQLSR
ncbi:MAG: cell division protein ZapA [Christensenellales bacterium]|jgi:cell division protein ZapA